MYKRVLLKLSGEALSGNNKNFDPEVLKALAAEIKEVQELGVEVAIVVGGGNFIRGKTLNEMGADILAVDKVEAYVQEIANFCSEAICADLANEEEA